MKHAAVLYTCVGLMGAAAVTGFVDYTRATKAGFLEDLYVEKTGATGVMLPEKTITIDDYSRGPLNYVPEEEIMITEVPKKPLSPVKQEETPPPPSPVADAPPPPNAEIKIDVIAPPPPPEPGIIISQEDSLTPAPEPVPEQPVAPSLETTPAKPAKPRISTKMFSRAPLDYEYKAPVSKRKRKK